MLLKKAAVSSWQQPMTASTISSLGHPVEYIIQPVSGQAKLLRNCSKTPLRISDGPRFHLDIQFGEIPIVLCDHQYQAFVKLLEVFNLRFRAQLYQKWRPSVPVKERWVSSLFCSSLLLSPFPLLLPNPPSPLFLCPLPLPPSLSLFAFFDLYPHLSFFPVSLPFSLLLLSPLSPPSRLSSSFSLSIPQSPSRVLCATIWISPSPFSPRAWWKFATDCVLHKIQDRNKRHSKSFALKRARQNVVYVLGYTQHLTQVCVHMNVGMYLLWYNPHSQATHASFIYGLGMRSAWLERCHWANVCVLWWWCNDDDVMVIILGV